MGYLEAISRRPAGSRRSSRAARPPPRSPAPRAARATLDCRRPLALGLGLGLGLGLRLGLGIGLGLGLGLGLRLRLRHRVNLRRGRDLLTRELPPRAPGVPPGGNAPPPCRSTRDATAGGEEEERQHRAAQHLGRGVQLPAARLQQGSLSSPCSLSWADLSLRPLSAPRGRTGRLRAAPVALRLATLQLCTPTPLAG